MNYRSLVGILVLIVFLATACQSPTQNPKEEADPTPSLESFPNAPLEVNEPEAVPSVVSLVEGGEPGVPLTVTVRAINGQTEVAIPQAEIYARQTDDAGFYHEDAAGMPRIHGRLHTNAAGISAFRTILPGRYPEDPTATRHIHLTVTAVGYEPLERVLLFDNDPYLTDEERTFEFSVVASLQEDSNGGWITEIELALLPLPVTEMQTFELVAGRATYRVEEEFMDVPDWLARHDLAAGLATAVGTTEEMIGELQIDISQNPPLMVNGQFTVDLMSLMSDQEGRDNSVRRDLFGDGRFPTATFVIHSLADFPPQFRQGEAVAFQLLGDLMLHEQTETVLLTVTAVWDNDTITGTATGNILLGDFGLTPPSLLGLLTVSEEVTIELEFDLHVAE